MSKPVGIVGRISTDHCDKGKGEEDQDQEDFTAGEPEFGFTVGPDGEDIQSPN